MKAKSFLQSNWFIFILAFLLGWCTYSLKLVSIIKLLGELDFSFYPLLMLVQGLSFFGSMKLMNKVSEKNERMFYFISLVSGFALVFFTSSLPLNNWAQQQFGWLYSCCVFMLSSFIILAIEITTRLLVIGKISLLENPKAAAHVSFSLELGVILGASLTLILSKSAVLLPEVLLPIFSALPFGVSLYCLYLISRQDAEIEIKPRNKKIQLALKNHSTSLNENIKTYLPYLIALIAVVMICKNLQGFAVFMGLKEWQENSNKSISTIFSILALVQNGLILLFILPSFFVRDKSTVWSNGFKFYFYFQAASMFFISLFPFAQSLIGTGIIRKITQRSFLNQSLNMLFASIPRVIRFKVKGSSQKYAHTISYVFLACLSYLAINGVISYTSVWFIAGLLSLSGAVILRQLLIRLNKFHVENIKAFNDCPFNVYEAICSCYALANRDAAKYYKDIVDVLMRENTRSIIRKALIHAIGEMKDKHAPQLLMSLFKQFPREDVQLEILIALNKHKGLEIDNFFQNVLKNTMYFDTNRGELKISFCEVISQRMPHPTISLATEAIESNPTDFRVIGNAIDVLGDIAKRIRSRNIIEYLARFLAAQYPRRVRINAIKHLYRVKQYREEIAQIILSVHTSSRLEDQCGAAYLYGVLGISAHLDFIQTLNNNTGRKNSTVLLSLLRLNQKGVELDFINLLKDATHQEAIIYINQLYRVRNERLRYSVYFALLQYYPQHVSDILHLLRDSFKNFDQDRQVIIEEAEKLGIPISDDLLYQVN